MTMDFLETLLLAEKEKRIPESARHNFGELYSSYKQSMIRSGFDTKACESIFFTYLRLVEEQIKKPYHFEPFHKRIEAPFNYFAFGLDFMRPLVDKDKSKICYLKNIEKMRDQVGLKENVILFANHQTETDPQLLNIVLEEQFSDFAKEVIFVAGDRVITDLMAIPFSMGCNLLCIYSKRHIDNPPEKKEEKLLHNQRTMKRMKEILAEGGRCIYVAPSGGRDRPNERGEVWPAPFDAQSVEMFRLMTLQSQKKAHFYPLALATYDILPPPRTVKRALGEVRLIKREGVHFAFGDEIDMDDFPGSDLQDKQAKRVARSEHIWNLVKREYGLLK